MTNDRQIAEPMTVTEENAAKPDYLKEIIVAFMLCLLGCFLIISSLQMPSDEITPQPNMFYAAPGLFPMIAGVGITVLSLVLAIKYFLAMRRTSKLHPDEKILKKPDKKKLFRFAAAAIILFIYVFVGLGRLSYPISTFLYLIVAMMVFRNNRTPIWGLVLISVAAAVLITYLFGTLALIPLP